MLFDTNKTYLYCVLQYFGVYVVNGESYFLFSYIEMRYKMINFDFSMRQMLPRMIFGSVPTFSESSIVSQIPCYTKSNGGYVYSVERHGFV